jgi:hypothetical protein
VNIVTDYLYPGWRAYDADSYDGATDSPAPITGYGKTEQQAIDDLMAQLEERDDA